MKKFNTTAVCLPSRHYMVDLTERVEQIKKMVDEGEYFTINRARQYGKTTTLNALKNRLLSDYQVISLSFQGIGNAGFATEGHFCQAFAGMICDYFEYEHSGPEEISQSFNQIYEQSVDNSRLDKLFRLIRKWCSISEKPLVLMIDEIDSATNNQVFLDFLAQLRQGYIGRSTDGIPAFQSVILAGVTDIKHLKSRIRDEDQHRLNSPWNIAADFTVDMSFSVKDIAGMLKEYEKDHETGMDLYKISQSIYDYTSGYPFLVSRICQLIDEDLTGPEDTGLSERWTKNGVDDAVRTLLAEKNSLFESLTGKLINYPALKKNVKSILMEGRSFSYNPDQEELEQMQMYGFIVNQNGLITISNRIFETRLYNYFLSDEEFMNNEFSERGASSKNIFVTEGRLNMKMVLEHFIKTFNQIFGPLTDRFKERDGRELFLLYLKPIINGTGNYYIEAETRSRTRTDVIVDYLGQQFVIELKIWRGSRYNEEGEKQIRDYLDHFNLQTGYMLSFNFNKKKEPGVKTVRIDDKLLYEATV